MIAVIADDLTGAAELGGIGLRYGLHVEINTRFNPNTQAELIVISTDSRSMNRQDAIAISSEVTSKTAALKPQFIFKKTDSALRGHVIPELEVMMKAIGVKRVLLLPANPALGRKIIDGLYYVHGQLIHTTGFAEDPEFPVKSSRVMDMVAKETYPITVKKLPPQNPPQSRTCGEYRFRSPDSELPEGIVIGEVESVEDLKSWALIVHNDKLMAGGSGFFTALLDNHLISKTQVKEPAAVFKPEHPALYIIGTAFQRSLQAVKRIKEEGGPVSYMPASIIRTSHPSQTEYKNWSDEVITLISRFGKAIIAIEENSVEGTGAGAKQLREQTAEVVQLIFQQITLRELIIEGGSTANAIISALGWNRFIAVKELSAGVVRMKVPGKENLHVTIKPGSYEWPSGLLKY